MIGRGWRSGLLTGAALAVGFIAVLTGGLLLLNKCGGDPWGAPSDGAARRAVAEFLCPHEPERALPHLVTSVDSSTRWVSVYSIDDQDGALLDFRALFYVGKDEEDRAYVSPPDVITRKYVEEARAACAAGEELP